VRWQSITGTVLGVAGAALLWRGYRNTHVLEVTRLTAPIRDLPESFRGFRLLQLSDLHLRQRSARAAELLALVREHDPDLVCLTGDYAFSSLSLPEVDAFLAELGQRPAVVGVFGNADYRPDFDGEARASWARHIPFLTNAALCLERGEDRLWVAGVDDPHQGRDELSSALAPVPDGAPVILLAHSPEVILRPLDPRIRLILCGHTHGGQICLPGGTALYHNMSLPRAFSSGLHQLGGVTLYISRGVGSTRLQLRYGCPPEITLVTLQRSQDQA